jgi:hypothetical protein
MVDMKRTRKRRGVGRPVLWKEIYVTIAYEMALLGATDAVLARALNITEERLRVWKAERPEFYEALQAGKDLADARVAHSLYKRAVGYEYEEEIIHVVKGMLQRVVVTKRVHPDPWSAHKWLISRQRGVWTDLSKSEVTHTNININKFDFNGLTTQELQLVEKIGLKQLAENLTGN